MPYFMRRNHLCNVPKVHYVVDCETIPCPVPGEPGTARHQLMLGVCRGWQFDGPHRIRQSEHVFRTREEFWDWLLMHAPTRSRVWIWAHNASFDFTTLGLWLMLDSGRLQLKKRDAKESAGEPDESKGREHSGLIITADPPFVIDCIDGMGHSFRFIDSCNYAFTSLKKIGEMVSIPKLDMPGDLGTDDDWLAYCRRDVEILEELVSRICGIVMHQDLGNMQVTLAAQSMSHFRHKHLPDDMLIGPDEKIRPLERAAYYGARQEVYFKGCVLESGMEGMGPLAGVPKGMPYLSTGPVYRIDCVSCYPFVMGANLYPTRPWRKHFDIPLNELLDLLKMCECVAAVHINSAAEPWPKRYKKHVYWRVGQFDTTLCGEELRRAATTGVIKKVYVCQSYNRAAIFSKWAREMIGIRRAYEASGHVLEGHLIKRMSNSLHGKFGQAGRQWTVVPGAVGPYKWGQYMDINYDTQESWIRRTIAGVVQQLADEDDGEQSCPIVSACVCAAAREHMRAARQSAGQYHVLYEDADSLHVDAKGMENLLRDGWIRPDMAGKFRTEGEAARAVYHGVKNYQFGEERVCAGRKPDAQQTPHGAWQQTEFVGLDSLLAHGIPLSPVAIDREVSEPDSQSPHGYQANGWISFRTA